MSAIPRATRPAPEPQPQPQMEGIDPLLLGRAVWEALPLMMAVSLMVTLAASVTAGVAWGFSPLAPAFAALTLGPIWLGACAVAHRMLDGEAVGIRDLCAETTGRARTGVAIALVPAAVATVLLGSVGIMGADPGQRWLLLPIALDATVLVLVSLGSVFAFPLAVTSGVRGRARWLAALSLAGRNLVPTLGVASILTLLALSTRLVGPILALVLTGPLALLCVAVTRRAVARAISGSTS